MDTMDTMDKCYKCGINLVHNDNPGFATDHELHKFCYACCAEMDKEEMRGTGKAVLYLTSTPHTDTYMVTNWPGTLRFPIYGQRQGKHNMAGKRYDVWFRFEGANWHGVTYGDNTQLCHCKRVK